MKKQTRKGFSLAATLMSINKGIGKEDVARIYSGTQPLKRME